MGEHGLIRQYLFSALFSTHGHGRVEWFSLQRALLWTLAAKKPQWVRLSHPAHEWDTHTVINGSPDFFAWWTRHQSGNDRVSTEDDYWQPNMADVETDFSFRQIKFAMWQIPATRVPNRGLIQTQVSGKNRCPALAEPQPR